MTIKHSNGDLLLTNQPTNIKMLNFENIFDINIRVTSTHFSVKSVLTIFCIGIKSPPQQKRGVSWV